MWQKTSLYPTENVKYLGLKIDTNLIRQYHVNDFFIKLSRVNALLFKMRNKGNMLDQFILLFWTPTYPTAVLFGLRIVALFNKL